MSKKIPSVKTSNFRKSMNEDFDFTAFQPEVFDIHKKSFEEFLQLNVDPKKRENKGLEKIFQSFFPIFHQKSKLTIEYCGYEILDPRYTIAECVKMGITYGAALKILVRSVSQNGDTKETISTIGEIPMITPEGTFIINGHERVFVGQIQKCPGILFEQEVDTSNMKRIFFGKIYPETGSWFHIQLRPEKSLLQVSVDKRKKFSITSLMLCYTRQLELSANFDQDVDVKDILDQFNSRDLAVIENGHWRVPFNKDHYTIAKLPFNIKIDNEIIARRGETLSEETYAKIQKDHCLLSNSDLVGIHIAEDIYDPNTGEIFIEIAKPLTEIQLESLKGRGNFYFYVVDDKHPDYIINSLVSEDIYTREEAIDEWARSIKVGTHYGSISLARMFTTRLINPKYYNLGKGRKRMNAALGLSQEKQLNYPDLEDIILICKELIKVQHGKREIDDIDSLVNKNFVSLSGIMESLFRTGMINFEKNVRDRYSFDVKDGRFSDVFNFRICIYPVLDGFYKLSQMLDDTNLLAILVQKRKLTSKPVGSNKESRASGNLRNTNGSKFGRTCPTQTPEGKNIGLVEHLTPYASIDEDGFIQTPYHVVQNGIASSHVIYISSIEERNKVISYKKYYREEVIEGETCYVLDSEYEFVVARKDNVLSFFHYKEVNFIDVAPNQIFSSSCSLIPFAGHCDPYRTLAAANMNVQALPLIELEAPYVSTGMDNHFGEKIRAKKSGTVSFADCHRIIIETGEIEDPVHIYYLTTNKKTNAETVIDHRPLVDIGDEVQEGQTIADGFTTYKGDLALGKNLLVAYISNAMVYEDAILASESLLHSDALSAKTIQCFECVVRDTRFGQEKNTRDIPGVSNNALINLDEFGIIRLGARVNGGDIAVGKITPVAADSNVQSSEKKLYNMIFGEKASDCTDNSLRFPVGTEGIVTDVQILTRKGMQKDDRALLYEKMEEDKILKEFNEKLDVITSVTKKNLYSFLKNEKLKSDFIVKSHMPDNLDEMAAFDERINQAVEEVKKQTKSKKRTKPESFIIEKEIDKLLDSHTFKKGEQFSIAWEDFNLMSFSEIKKVPIENKKKLESIISSYEKNIQDIKDQKETRLKLIPNYEMQDGVLKVIRVFVSTKRRIESGDKLCARYGNKGVISDLWPEVDMPYQEIKTIMPDGSERIIHQAADIVINPLGLISRMNLGQVFETTFGHAINHFKTKLKTITDYCKRMRDKESFQLLRSHLDKIINKEDLRFFNLKGEMQNLKEEELISLSEYFVREGVNLKFTQFRELPKDQVSQILLDLTGSAESKSEFYDGRTGEKLYGKVLCGYQYIERLIHLVALKHHARNVGPYNLNNQQPTGGKARRGGQRLGEMEVWSTEGHGAAFFTFETLTAKSDEFKERNQLFSKLTKGAPYSITVDYSHKKKSSSFSRLSAHLLSACLKLWMDVNEKGNKICCIKLIGADEIRALSYGEVKKEESVNYRTFTAVPGGLFCSQIFGPTKDFECDCKRYKGTSAQGIVCEKCHVEVAPSSVRQERMGHIELPVKVVHPWFLKTSNNKIAILLDMPLKEMKRIANLEKYVVLEKGESTFEKYSVISRRENEEHQLTDGFVSETGAEALYQMLSSINLDERIKEISEILPDIKSEISRKKHKILLNTLLEFKNSGVKPQSMILECIAVLPADLRPLVELDGGQFVSSDLNDLYRRVIYRAKRLKRVMETVILVPENLHSEIRMLQEAVNKLFGAGGDSKEKDSRVKKYKSLEEKLKGKEGDLRKFMLGKRTDFSGRSVIVIDPSLKIDECRIPKEMALEIFKPAVIGKLKSTGIAMSIRHAKRLIENRRPEVWKVLNDIIETTFPVMLLNRAPTLHRIGILAFKVKLWDRKSIGINALVCPGFNADFDGDQMATHAVLSAEAKAEAIMLMTPSKNLGSPTTGNLNVGAFKDMAFGIYALTLASGVESKKSFSSITSVEYAVENKDIEINSYIHLLKGEEIFKTTAGRVLFWKIIPKDCGITFSELNCEIKNTTVSQIMKNIRKNLGDDALAIFADDVKDLGFKYAFYFNGSTSVEDFLEVPNAKKFIKNGLSQQLGLVSKFYDGLISNNEMRNRSFRMREAQKKEHERAIQQLAKENPFNPVFMIVNSGARGSMSQMLQILFMKGTVSDINGEPSFISVDKNYKDGLDMAQYFLVSQGSRKGVADTALKTAESGHLTRRLVDVSHSCVIRNIDCGTKNYINAKNTFYGGKLQTSVYSKILGRFTALDIKVPSSQKILLPKNTFIDQNVVDLLQLNEITEVPVRSVVFCDELYGACVACYGSDLSTNKPVNIGESVGIIAAQAIGEPATQLTMRSFHTGGVTTFSSTGTEAITPFAGRVEYDEHMRTVVNSQGQRINISRNIKISVKNKNNMSVSEFNLPYGAVLLKENNEVVESGTLLSNWTDTMPIIAESDGKCNFSNFIKGVNFETFVDESVGKKKRLIMKDKLVPYINFSGETNVNIPLQDNTVVNINDGDLVKQGDVIAYTRSDVRTIDITDGLQQVIAVLENRPMKTLAILSEHEGTIEIKQDSKGKTVIMTHTPEGQTFETQVGGGTLNVRNNEYVRVGDFLTTGSPSMQDILDKRTLEELINYFVSEVESIYLEQAIYINQKHFEVILQQMLKKNVVTSSEQPGIMEGMLIDVSEMDANIKKKINSGNIIVRRIITGITNAALNASSFLSAASFQEVISVLIQSAVTARVDPLIGLKENIILGTIIPCGTGWHFYQVSKEIEKTKKMAEEAAGV
jgi:DNA-directed RNA polymerase subunit beta-beta'